MAAWLDVILEELRYPQLLNKFHAVYGNRVFVNAFTTACYLSLSPDRPIQSSVRYHIHNSLLPAPLSRQTNPVHVHAFCFVMIHFNIIPSGLSHSGFPTEILHAFLFFLMHSTWLVHFIFLNSISNLPTSVQNSVKNCPVYTEGADKSLARPGRKHATATEDFDFHISYL